jgi:cytochrome bd-type quinol oxidase subunit 2
MLPTMVKHLLLAVLGLAHAIVAWVVAFATAAFVLDRYTSDTAFGTFVQIVPFALIALLIVAYPAYLVTKKRTADAAIVFGAAVIGIVALVLLTRVAHAPVVTVDPCTSDTRDALSEEEKLACPNWCPYKGPLLGGNYWTENGEECVYL